MRVQARLVAAAVIPRGRLGEPGGGIAEVEARRRSRGLLRVFRRGSRWAGRSPGSRRGWPGPTRRKTPFCAPPANRTEGTVPVQIGSRVMLLTSLVAGRDRNAGPQSPCRFRAGDSATDLLGPGGPVRQLWAESAPGDWPVGWRDGGHLSGVYLTNGVCGGDARAGPAGPVGEFAEPLAVPGDGDAAVGQVEVVRGEVADRGPAGGVDRGLGDDQPLRRAGGGLFDGPRGSGRDRRRVAAAWFCCG